MSDPALFKDFGKSANDLLFKGFPDSDKFDWKVEFSTSSNGSTFIPRLTKSHDKEAPVGELEAKFGYKPLNVDLTTKIDQNYAIKTEVSTNQVKNGLKFKPSLEINTNAQQANVFAGTTTKVGLEVRHQKFTFSGSVNVPLENLNFTTAFSGTAGYKDCGFAAGGDVELTNDGTPKSSSFGINYSPSSSFAINGYYKNRQVKGGSSSVVGVSFYNKVASGWKDSAVAADVSYDLASPAPNSSLALGALLKLDDSSNFKFRLNNKGFLSLAYTNQITRPLSVALSADLNVVNNSALRPGVKFTFTD